MTRIYRPKIQAKFTMVSNEMLLDPNLGVSAKYLMTVMSGLPDSWDFTIKGMSTILKMGRNTIASALSQLEANGYIERVQTRNADGTFGSNDIQLYSSPKGKVYDEVEMVEADERYERSSEAIDIDEIFAYQPSPKNCASVPKNCASVLSEPCTKKRATVGEAQINTKINNNFNNSDKVNKLDKVNKVDLVNNNKQKKIKEKREIYKEKKESVKKRYSEFVLMTEEEYQKLVEQFGEAETLKWIERLDDYKASTGKKYVSDYRTILVWTKRDQERKGVTPKQEKSQGHDELKDLEKYWFEALAHREKKTNAPWSYEIVHDAYRFIDWHDSDMEFQKIQFLFRIKGLVN